MKVYSILSLIIGVCLFSCTTNKEPVADENGIVHINLVNSHEINIEPLLADIASKIEYVALECNDSCALSNPIKFVATNNFFFFVTEHGNYRFSKDGKFINKYGAKGQGPGEYNVITDLAVDMKQKLVYALDVMGNRIITYSLNGSFVNNIPLSHFTFQFYFLSGNDFAVSPYDYQGNRLDKLAIINQKGDTIQKYGNPVRFKPEGYAYVAMPFNCFRAYDDEVRYFQNCNDTLFTITKDNELKPKYIFDTGKYNITPTMLSSEAKYSKIANNKYEIQYVIENKHHLFLEYKYKEQQHKIVYYKESGKISQLALADSLGIRDNINAGLPFWPLQALNNKKMYSVNMALTVRDQLDEMIKKGIEIPENLKELNKNLKISDNPVIQIITNL